MSRGDLSSGGLAAGMPTARMTTGELYADSMQRQFRGQGLRRSCGKCGVHGSTAGSKKVRPWGLVNVCCLQTNESAAAA